MKTYQRLRSEAHNIFTEKVNKLGLSPNDSKRKQMFNSVILHPYDTGTERVGKTELLEYVKMKK